jgi:hypothetical protein
MSFEYHEPLIFAFDLNVIPRSIIFTGNMSEKESFLIEACRAAHGDTKKKIDISQIYQKLDLSEEHAEPLSKITKSLVAEGHITQIAYLVSWKI